MMIDPEILFRRKAAGFIAASVTAYIILIILLRISYSGAVNSVIQAYGATQQEAAERTAFRLDEDLYVMSRRVRQVAENVGAQCLSQPAACRTMLERQYGILSADGALDVIFLDTSGRMPLTLNKFFSKGWPDEANAVQKTALGMSPLSRYPVAVSDVFVYFDQRNKPRPAVAMAAPVFATVTITATQSAATGTLAPSATATQSATNTAPAVQVRKPIGVVMVPVGFEQFSRRIQKAAPPSGSRFLAVFGLARLNNRSTQVILSHPDPDYVGANAREIFNLAEFPRLNDIMNTLLRGKSGVEDYVFSADPEKQGMDNWWMAYSPDRERPGVGVAITWKEADVPLIGSFFWKYFTVALACLLILVPLNLLPLIEHRKHISTHIELKKMHDTHAINEMLRNVNQELTETKKTLEARTREIQALHEQRMHLIDQITHTQYRLFGTVKKPSREQRELMRSLKRDVQAMSRKPEARFWKKTEE